MRKINSGSNNESIQTSHNGKNNSFSSPSAATSIRGLRSQNLGQSRSNGNGGTSRRSTSVIQTREDAEIFEHMSYSTGVSLKNAKSNYNSSSPKKESSISSYEGVVDDMMGSAIDMMRSCSPVSDYCGDNSGPVVESCMGEFLGNPQVEQDASHRPQQNLDLRHNDNTFHVLASLLVEFFQAKVVGRTLVLMPEDRGTVQRMLPTSAVKDFIDAVKYRLEMTPVVTVSPIQFLTLQCQELCLDRDEPEENPILAALTLKRDPITLEVLAVLSETHRYAEDDFESDSNYAKNMAASSDEFLVSLRQSTDAYENNSNDSFVLEDKSSPPSSDDDEAGIKVASSQDIAEEMLLEEQAIVHYDDDVNSAPSDDDSMPIDRNDIDALTPITELEEIISTEEEDLVLVQRPDTENDVNENFDVEGEEIEWRVAEFADRSKIEEQELKNIHMAEKEHDAEGEPHAAHENTLKEQDDRVLGEAEFLAEDSENKGDVDRYSIRSKVSSTIQEIGESDGSAVLLRNSFQDEIELQRSEIVEYSQERSQMLSEEEYSATDMNVTDKVKDDGYYSRHLVKRNNTDPTHDYFKGTKAGNFLSPGSGRISPSSQTERVVNNKRAKDKSIVSNNAKGEILGVHKGVHNGSQENNDNASIEDKKMLALSLSTMKEEKKSDVDSVTRRMHVVADSFFADLKSTVDAQVSSLQENLREALKSSSKPQKKIPEGITDALRTTPPIGFDSEISLVDSVTETTITHQDDSTPDIDLTDMCSEENGSFFSSIVAGFVSSTVDSNSNEAMGDSMIVRNGKAAQQAPRNRNGEGFDKPLPREDTGRFSSEVELLDISQLKSAYMAHQPIDTAKYDSLDVLDPVEKQQLLAELAEAMSLVAQSVTPETKNFWHAHVTSLQVRIDALHVEPQRKITIVPGVFPDARHSNLIPVVYKINDVSALTPSGARSHPDMNQPNVFPFVHDAVDHSVLNTDVSTTQLVVPATQSSNAIPPTIEATSANELFEHSPAAAPHNAIESQSAIHIDQGHQEETHHHSLELVPTPKFQDEQHNVFYPVPKVDVVAPADLPGGYHFEAEIEGQRFLATVPPGGVQQGETFTCDMRELDSVAIDIPVGYWKDGLCHICELGWCHPVVWCSVLCPLVTLGQVQTRINLDFLGRPKFGDLPMSNRTMILTIIFFWGLTNLSLFAACNLKWSRGLELSAGDVFAFAMVNVSMFGFVVFVTQSTRSSLREKFMIREERCFDLEDICCATACLSCTVAQMARHTANYDDYEAVCCSKTGLPNGVRVNQKAPTSSGELDSGYVV